MKYYHLFEDMDRTNDVICHYTDDYNIPLGTFFFGKVYNEWNDKFEFYYDVHEGEILTDFIANDKGWFLVSEKLKSIFESMNTEIQFIPVKLNEINSMFSITYYIANILRIADALCLEKSDYFEKTLAKTGTLYFISRYCIYDEKTNNSDIFKIKNGNRCDSGIFVSERFKQAIENEGITGIYLHQIRTV